LGKEQNSKIGSRNPLWSILEFWIGNLLLTHVLMLKNTTKRPKCPNGS